MDKMVLFDFDGVIALNTEEITMSVIANLVNRSVNEVSDLVMGMGGKMLIETLNKTYNLNISEKEIMYRRMEIMKQDSILKKDPSLIPFLDMLKFNNVKYTIVTSSSRPPVEIALKKLNLNKYFDLIYSMDDFDFIKSKCDLYKIIGDKYKNNKILIIEDSLRGITNAYESNIGSVIAYAGCDGLLKNNSKYFNFVRDKVIKIAYNFDDICYFIGF